MAGSVLAGVLALLRAVRADAARAAFAVRSRETIRFRVVLGVFVREACATAVARLAEEEEVLSERATAVAAIVEGARLLAGEGWWLDGVEGDFSEDIRELASSGISSPDDLVLDDIDMTVGFVDDAPASLDRCPVELWGRDRDCLSSAAAAMTAFAVDGRWVSNCGG